ncbi:MAG: 2-hydroxy-3-oxopropionate reductase [Candidatus Solibacter sp.]|nr:2-hydroxy-3-oxopropionate reductase [Candidatus Solibacter sp.]
MKVGFVGLGIMGKPMSRNLMKAGHELVVYDIAAGAVDVIVADGAALGESSSDVAARSEVTITMLPDGPEVEAAITGPGGVLSGAAPGSIVVDMSSISPLAAQRVAAACAAKGVEFLDAPVSGGEPKAVDGTLAIMAGGKREVFDKVLPLFGSMGSSATLTGPVGAGNVTKLANQIMVAVNIAGVSEALALATKAGLDPELVFNAVKGGLAGSTVLNAKAPMMIGRNFKPGFRVRLHQKDLRNALLAAESMQLSLPFTSLAQQVLIALMNNGRGEFDHSAIANFIEDMGGVVITRPAGG